MKSKITSLTRPSHFTLPLSNIVLQFTHPHQPGSIQEMLRSPHASELALHQCERGRGLRCTLRTRRRLCGGGLLRRATLRCCTPRASTPTSRSCRAARKGRSHMPRKLRPTAAAAASPWQPSTDTPGTAAIVGTLATWVLSSRRIRDVGPSSCQLPIEAGVAQAIPMGWWRRPSAISATKEAEPSRGHRQDGALHMPCHCL